MAISSVLSLESFLRLEVASEEAWSFRSMRLDWQVVTHRKQQ